ncbi:hypothetical protein BGZ73_006595 [Actinomortierella ambigua]|nr:hypothetical protein BGZ73_006595 [Actinomortierella ambigua]
MMDHERGVEAGGKDRLMALSDMASSAFPHTSASHQENKTTRPTSPNHYPSDASRIKDEHDSGAAEYSMNQHRPQSPIDGHRIAHGDDEDSTHDRRLRSSRLQHDTSIASTEEPRSGRGRSRRDSQDMDADYTFTDAPQRDSRPAAGDEADQDSFIRTRSRTRQSATGNNEDDGEGLDGNNYSSSMGRKRRRVPDRHYRERSNSLSENDETVDMSGRQQRAKVTPSDHRLGSEEDRHPLDGDDGDEEDDMDEEQANLAGKERDGSESVETSSSKNDDGSEPTSGSAQDNPANVKVRSMFIDKLYSMVEDQAIQHLIAWAEAGDMFYVFNCIELASTVLPKFFKHNNWQSFVRQLNKESTMNRKNPETQRWQFYHPEFQRDQPHLRNNIKRKSARTNNSSSATFSRVMYERDKGYFMHREPVPRVMSGTLPGQRHSSSAIMTSMDASGRPLAPHHGQTGSPSGYSGMRQPAQDPSYRPMGSRPMHDYRHDLSHGAVEQDERGSVDYGSDPRYAHGRVQRPSIESASPYMSHHRDERAPPPSHRPYPSQSYPHQNQPPSHGYPHHPSPYSPPHSSPRHPHERQNSTIHPMQRPPSPASLTDHPLDHKHHPHPPGAPGHSPDMPPTQGYPAFHHDPRTQSGNHRQPGASVHHRTSTGYHLQQHETGYSSSGGHFRSQSAPGADPRTDGSVPYPSSAVPQQPSPKLPLTPSQGSYPTSYRPHSPPTTGPSSATGSEQAQPAQSAPARHRSSTQHGPVQPISPPMPPEEATRYRENAAAGAGVVMGGAPALPHNTQGNAPASVHQGDERAKTSPSTAPAQLALPAGTPAQPIEHTHPGSQQPPPQQTGPHQPPATRPPGAAPVPQQQPQQQLPPQPQRHPSYSSASSSSLQPALPITSPPTPSMSEPQLLEWIPQYVRQLEKKMSFMEDSYASLRQLTLEMQDVQKAQFQTIEWMRDRLERLSPEDMHSPSHVPAKRKADHDLAHDHHSAQRYNHGHSHTASYSGPLPAGTSSVSGGFHPGHAYSRSGSTSMYTHQHRDGYRGPVPASGTEDTSGPYDPAAYPTSGAPPGAYGAPPHHQPPPQQLLQQGQQPTNAPSARQQQQQQATSPHPGHHLAHHQGPHHPLAMAAGGHGTPEASEFGPNGSHIRERSHTHSHHHSAPHHRQSSSMIHPGSAASPPRGVAYATQPQLQQ